MLIKAQTARLRAAGGREGTSAGNEPERLLEPIQTQIRDLTSANAKRTEVLSKIICAGVAFAIIGKTVIGKSNDGKTNVGKSKGNKY